MNLTRRQWLASHAAALSAGESSIDRRAMVARHNCVNTNPNPLTPLSVGNGKFAFTADVTGLQSYFDLYTGGMPLGTMSDWGWHTWPNPERCQLEDVLSEFENNGRKVKYPGRMPADERGKRAWAWLRTNPHRLHLGQIGMELLRAGGSRIDIGELRNIRQQLDLWTGTLTSRFEADGESVSVVTACHPDLDAISVRIESKLILQKRLRLFWSFPYGTGAKTGADWTNPSAHITSVLEQGVGWALVLRTLDEDRYAVALSWSGHAKLNQTAAHRLVLEPESGARALEMVTYFAPNRPIEAPQAQDVFRASRGHWPKFWQSGAVIDLSRSRDPRWKELERRVVLSEYQTAIQCAGLNPPQESGLTHNSWNGKFHLEMTAWHGVHFALWGREQMLARHVEWLRTTGLRAARERARAQGYAGARWNKMIDARGSWESPSLVGPFRTTQQGHMIYLAELLYRCKPSRETLEKYREMVFESAKFMADFPAWDADKGAFVLGPPIISGAEATPPEAQNPTVELSYWMLGLDLAQKWRERLGLKREARWDEVRAKLSPLPQRHGIYVDTESHPDARGRAALLEVYGCMPGTGVDKKTMGRTYLDLTKGLKSWAQMWGCDFPMLAMTAARLGRPSEAVDWLLYSHARNEYRSNGHLLQTPGIPVYLPANGGLLWAVAMMAAGWEGGPERNAPGFPESWNVRCVGFTSSC